jgi:Gene product 88
MTLTEAIKITGGLSEPSKMPCYSYNLPARECKIGSKLREVPNSVCHTCYAFRGNYGFKTVQSALDRRLKNTRKTKWVEAMTFLINATNSNNYFRFFDSGDLQSARMLKNICKIAENLPHIKFWLPTKEYSLVFNFAKHNKIPDNLIIRLSAYMIDQPIPNAVREKAKKYGFVFSEVTRDLSKMTCPSKFQQNKCLTCRNCWDKTVETVTYKAH